MSAAKEEVQTLLDKLPDDCSLEDITKSFINIAS